MKKIIQIGFPKSGNYLLYSILKQILIYNKAFISYKKKYVTFYKEYSTVPDCDSIDQITILGKKLRLVILNSDINNIVLNPDKFIENSSIIWTHDKITKDHINMFQKVNKWFYVYRDGRDVINSLMHYVVSPIVLKRMSEYKIDNLQELYQNYSYFEKHVIAWKNHIETAFKYRNHLFFLSFEDLVFKKKQILNDIKKYLGMNFSDMDIIAATDKTKMKKIAPYHVRKGIKGDWSNYFTNKHKEIFKKNAGNQLIQLGYENDLNW